MTRAISALLLVAALAGGFWLFIQRGFSTRTPPGTLEAWAANHMREWSVPARYKAMRNPVQCSSLPPHPAMAHWADHCATCHANNGSGQTPIGKNVYPKAPDLRLADTQSMSDGEIFWVIHNGIRFTAMAAWGEGDPAQDMGSWKLVHFIRHLSQLTPEELDQMKALNPTTKKDLEEEAASDQFLQGDDSAAARTDSGHHH